MRDAETYVKKARGVQRTVHKVKSEKPKSAEPTQSSSVRPPASTFFDDAALDRARLEEKKKAAAVEESSERRREASQVFDDVDLDRTRMERSRAVRQRVNAALHVQSADDIRDGLPAEASKVCWGCYGATGKEDYVYCKVCAVRIAVPEEVEAFELGKQSAYITKLIDNKEALLRPECIAAMEKEIRRLFEKVLGKPVCLDSVPENSQVVIAKLLISVKIGKVQRMSRPSKAAW